MTTKELKLKLDEFETLFKETGDFFDNCQWLLFSIREDAYLGNQCLKAGLLLAIDDASKDLDYYWSEIEAIKAVLAQKPSKRSSNTKKHLS